MICKFCEKELKNKNSLAQHESRCPQNKDRKYKNGMTGVFGKIPWNKGLTKESSHKIASASVKISSVMKGKPGKSPSESVRMKISESMSLRGGNGTKAKWFNVSGQKVQGTWERDCAFKFNELGIKWKAHPHTIRYQINGKIKNYTPDFYLPEKNIYIEVKGFWWGNDKEKMNEVMNQNKHIKIVILFGDDFHSFIKTGILPL